MISNETAVWEPTQVMSNKKSGDLSGILSQVPSHNMAAHRNGVGKNAEVRCGVIVKNNDSHAHDFLTPQYACCYVVSGQGFYRDKNGKQTLQPGMAFQRKPNHAHDVFLEGPAVWYFVAIPAPVTALFSTCGIPTLMNCDPVFDPGLDRSIVTRWNVLIRKLTDIAHHQMALVMVDLIQLIVDLHVRALRRQQPHRHNEAIDKACKIMTDDMEAKITMPELATAVGLNYNTFRSTFSAHTGMSPQAWRMRLRLDKAKMILSESRLSIAAIAQQLGWKDPLDFSACFRRHTGRSPRKFRNEIGC